MVSTKCLVKVSTDQVVCFTNYKCLYLAGFLLHREWCPGYWCLLSGVSRYLQNKAFAVQVCTEKDVRDTGVYWAGCSGVYWSRCLLAGVFWAGCLEQVFTVCTSLPTGLKQSFSTAFYKGQYTVTKLFFRDWLFKEWSNTVHTFMYESFSLNWLLDCTMSIHTTM